METLSEMVRIIEVVGSGDYIVIILLTIDVCKRKSITAGEV